MFGSNVVLLCDFKVTVFYRRMIFLFDYCFSFSVGGFKKNLTGEIRGLGLEYVSLLVW